MNPCSDTVPPVSVTLPDGRVCRYDDGLDYIVPIPKAGSLATYEGALRVSTPKRYTGTRRKGIVHLTVGQETARLAATVKGVYAGDADGWLVTYSLEPV